MKGFEAVFVTDAGISEEALKESLEKIETTITRHHGTIESKHVWGKRRLAYTIRKKEFGIYHIWYLTGDGNMLEELQRQYTYMDEVLRFQTISVADIDKERDYFLHIAVASTETIKKIKKDEDEDPVFAEELGEVSEESMVDAIP